MTKRLLAIVIATMIALAITPVLAAGGLRPGSTAYVTADVLNLRDVPQGNIIGGARYGSAVTVLSGPDRNGYYRISYRGNEYFAYGQYLTGDYIETPESRSTARSNQQDETYTYACDSGAGEYRLMFVNVPVRLALRKGPSKDDTRKGWLQHGEPVLVELKAKTRNGYVRVQTLDGRTGYAYMRYLSGEKLEDMVYLYEICDGHEDGDYWLVESIQWYRDE